MIEDFRLKVFTTVASMGSFTSAARELGVSQPAVSQNIAELEKTLGVELFVRSRGAVTLTSAGATFLEYAQRILFWYSSAETLFAAKNAAGRKMTISIASDPAVASSMLPSLLSRLLAVQPNLSFRLLPKDRQDVDLRMWLEESSEPLLFSGSGVPAIQSIEALACTSGPRLASIAAPEMIPDNARIATWSGYSEKLPPELRARVAMESDVPDCLLAFAAKSPDVIAVVPRMDVREPLKVLSWSLHQLDMGLHFEPAESFASTDCCKLLLQMLA